MKTAISGIKRVRIPYFTSMLTGLCIALYFAIGFVSDFGTISEDTYILFGAPYAVDIYLGQFWGVITNSFIHILWYQLVGNLLLLLILGTIVERRSGSLHLFLFGLIASTITSCFQLALSNDAGLGLSGVNFALFGFVLARYFTDEKYKNVQIGAISALLSTILVLCIYLNLYQSWNFGLASMYSGFLWGVIIGATRHPIVKYFSYPLIFSIIIFCTVSLFYAPWAAEWQFSQGVLAHERGYKTAAIRNYTECIKIDPAHTLAKDNLRLIRIDELSVQAYNAHRKGDLSRARELYLEILKKDPKNAWAKANLQQLP
jgi:GlpG protein